MRGPIVAVCVALALLSGCARGPALDYDGKTFVHDYPTRAVSFTDVALTDGFWSPRIETNRKVTIPFAFGQSEETGRIKNFEIAAGTAEGAFCSRYAFDDSDVFKVIEGASYSLSLHPDPQLDSFLDVLIAKIAAAQEKDGYLYSARTIDPAGVMEMAGPERWSNLQWSHELYNVGHLYEAAVAHYQATGKKTLLNVALKSADHIAREFGPRGRKDVPGHQEIEIGLAKLYRVTGDKKYLDLAVFFLAQRGHTEGRKSYGEYAQDHAPVLEQTEAVGHSVRAAYMYSAMADIAALTGDRRYVAALDTIWDDVVSRKLYLTGGIGATGAWEGFGPPYELPNASAYAETCAAIANAFWNQRMFLLHQDARYIDVLERVLYNGLVSGVSLEGNSFFYPNPLASYGQHERSPWFPCACCPSNIPRFLPKVSGYVYGVSGDAIFVNLFIAGTARVRTQAGEIGIEQRTDYPWKGDVQLRVKPKEGPARFPLRVRIPGWARNEPVPGDLYRYTDTAKEQPTLKVNGETVQLRIDNGYVSIDRQWQAGDIVELSLPMPIRRVAAHDAVKDNVGRVAVERGPIVFTAEWPDNNGRVSNLVLQDASPLSAAERPELLNGLTVVTGEATALRYSGGRLVEEKRTLELIPYYAWAHRGKGEMAVWLARQPDKARPEAEPTVASRSKTKASGGRGIEAINDQLEPERSGDKSIPHFHWWPTRGTVEWVEYELDGPATVSEMSVYWLDDTGEGGTRVPAGWKAFYRQGDKWVPVAATDGYGVEKDRYNTVKFAPVRTTGLRLEIRLPEEFSSGIHEWRVR
jgi:uncharacterized protein